MGLTDKQAAWVDQAIGRKDLFLRLSIIGVVIGLGLAVFYTVQWLRLDDYPVGLRFVLVILILLNARQNLRQHKYTDALARLKSARLKSGST